ncbi:tripartite tricarboxylate transporter TctB family protein [Agarivorans sp. DSG3-1]|uniref:tripartite tricarboxylate transporter TctB family protein n=1 Tax=Agarivorans sp. DSG3-1 TaxID=3342249 RepID=UPI00398F3BF7
MRHWFSIGSLVFSLAFTIYGFSTLDLYDVNGRPGPGYFPLIIGIGLIICTGINTVKDLAAVKAKQQQAGAEGQQEMAQQPTYAKDTLVIASLVGLLIAVLNSAGAIIAMIVFMLLFLWYFNPGKTKQNISYAVLFPGAVYLLFDVWLQAGLPDGLLSYFY